MSTSRKIDFEPGLFDEGCKAVEQEEAKDLSTPPMRSIKKRHWLIPLMAILLMLACGALFMFDARTNLAQRDRTGRESSPFEIGSTAGSIQTPPSQPTALGEGILRAQSASPDWCYDIDVICTSVMSSNPTETLQKLIAALPKTQAKRFKIRLSVETIDVPPSDTDAASTIEGQDSNTVQAIR